jgi:hypothetical protein
MSTKNSPNASHANGRSPNHSHVVGITPIAIQRRACPALLTSRPHERLQELCQIASGGQIRTQKDAHDSRDRVKWWRQVLSLWQSAERLLFARTYTHVIPQPRAGRQVIMTRLHEYVSFRRLCQSPLSDLYHGPDLDKVYSPAKRCPSIRITEARRPRVLSKTLVTEQPWQP